MKNKFRRFQHIYNRERKEIGDQKTNRKVLCVFLLEKKSVILRSNGVWAGIKKNEHNQSTSGEETKSLPTEAKTTGTSSKKKPKVTLQIIKKLIRVGKLHAKICVMLSRLCSKENGSLLSNKQPCDPGQVIQFFKTSVSHHLY